MKSDPTAAAERLRHDQGYEYFYEDGVDAEHGYLSDLMELAEAWLDEHPADDGQAIDEAWLRSAGFTDDGYEHTILQLGRIRWNVWEGDDGWFYGDENIPAPKTRGELRMLVAGLKEGSNG